MKINKNYKSLTEAFKDFKKKSKIKVDRKSYVDITSGFNRMILDKVLEGYEVILPERMGALVVVGKKWSGLEKNPSIIYPKPIVLDYRYKFYWSKMNVFVENKQFYILRITREYKRKVSQLIKEGKEYEIMTANKRYVNQRDN